VIAAPYPLGTVPAGNRRRPAHRCRRAGRGGSPRTSRKDRDASLFAGGSSSARPCQRLLEWGRPGVPRGLTRRRLRIPESTVAGHHVPSYDETARRRRVRASLMQAYPKRGRATDRSSFHLGQFSGWPSRGAPPEASRIGPRGPPAREPGAVLGPDARLVLGRAAPVRPGPRYFPGAAPRMAAPAFATTSSCDPVPPEQPMAPTSLPASTSGIPPREPIIPSSVMT